MKNLRRLRRLVIAAAACGLAACQSQESQPPQQAAEGPRPGFLKGNGGARSNARPGKPPPPKPPSPEEVIAKFDADRDGALSAKEHLNEVVEEASVRFARIDRDRDGRLSGKELDDAKARREAMATRNGNAKASPPPQRPQSLLPQADGDQDGMIDAAEFQAAARRQAGMRFRLGDRDRDGRLTLAEMEAGPPKGRKSAEN